MHVPLRGSVDHRFVIPDLKQTFIISTWNELEMYNLHFKFSFY